MRNKGINAIGFLWISWSLSCTTYTTFPLCVLEVLVFAFYSHSSMEWTESTLWSAHSQKCFVCFHGHYISTAFPVIVVEEEDKNWGGDDRLSSSAHAAAPSASHCWHGVVVGLLTKQRCFYPMNQRRGDTQKKSLWQIYSNFSIPLPLLLLFFSKFYELLYSASLQVLSFLIMLSIQRLDFIWRMWINMINNHLFSSFSSHSDKIPDRTTWKLIINWWLHGPQSIVLGLSILNPDHRVIWQRLLISK